MSGDEIDDAIDRAVRDIMGAEPPAGLRHRVLLQLSTPEPRSSSRLLRFAVVAGVAACAIVAALVVREHQPAAPPLSVAAPPAVAPIVAPPVPVPQDREAATVATARARRTPAAVSTRGPEVPGPGTVAATSIAETDSTVQVEPLEPLGAIEITPAASTALTLDEITVAPLRMDAVRVDPLLSLPR